MSYTKNGWSFDCNLTRLPQAQVAPVPEAVSGVGDTLKGWGTVAVLVGVALLAMKLTK